MFGRGRDASTMPTIANRRTVLVSALLIKCGTLFTGLEATPIQGRSILVENGVIVAIDKTSELAKGQSHESVVDFEGLFVMPGLCDYHTHLAYGNAKTEEDIDLYAPVEFRAIRGLFMAQKTLNAGVTSLCNPGGPCHVGIAIRDAINTGLFDGPRVTTSGAYLTSRQGLTDWYPSWVGQPDTSIGHLVRSPTEAIEEIRVQVKDGVDVIKIAMDGTQMHPPGSKSTGLLAAFDQDEITRMVAECHRLGRRVIAHARGREATLYSARAGVDVIFHASWIDDEGIEAALKSGSALCPSLTLLVNNYEFSQPGDAASRGWSDWCKHESETAFRNLNRAYKAGVPILNGSESGFAMTPYGEWHAKEIEIMIKYIGMPPSDALRSATALTGSYMVDGGKSGALGPGKNADLVAVDGNPLADIRCLLDSERIRCVMLGGRKMARQDRAIEAGRVSDFSLAYWNDLYTRDHVAKLFAGAPVAGRA
jgi:imidazolonepropionase-like amidohydrolase